MVVLAKINKAVVTAGLPFVAARLNMDSHTRKFIPVQLTVDLCTLALCQQKDYVNLP